jgi:hypothetical protein
MHLKILLISSFILIAVASGTWAQSTQPQATPFALQQQSQLDQARQRNEEAQADYYRQQANKLRNPESRKTLWQNISDNPASALGVVGAIIVALVTLVSFLLNYRVSLNNQMDTQFYEALKRFGDKDSPAVRFSASAILSQMADHGRRNFQLTHPFKSLRNSRRVYFVTTRNQLVGGLLLEENTVALLGIRDALHGLVKIEPSQTIEMVYRANQRTMKDAFLYLIWFFGAEGAGSISEIGHNQWQHAASITEFESQVLERIVRSYPEKAESVFKSYSLTYEAIPVEQRGERRLKTQKDLRITFLRMNLIVNVYSLAFKNHHLADFTLKYGPLFLVHSFLSEADLEMANLSGSYMFKADLMKANLRRANLSATWLRGANLFATKLWRATISARTDLSDTNWWQANYFGENDTEIDAELLEQLFDLYGDDVPTDQEDIHPSVKRFLAQRRTVST